MSRRPAQRPRSLPPSLTLLGGLAALFVLVELALLLEDGAAEPTWVVVLFPLEALLYFAVGLVAWHRRPANGTGALLFLGGFAFLAAGLANVPSRPLVGLGLILAPLPLAVIVHLLLAFPSGRLDTRLAVRLVIAAYVVNLVVRLPLVLFDPTADPMESFVRLSPEQTIYDITYYGQRVLNAIVLVSTCVLLASRVIGSSASERAALGALYLYGALAAAAMPFAASVLPAVFGLDAVQVAVVQLAVLAGIPPAFLVAVMRGGFARSDGVAGLARLVGRDPDRSRTVEEALAAALGDPSARLHLVAESTPEPPTRRAAGQRGSVDVTVRGELAARIEYDAGLIGDAESVRSVADLIAILLERDTLARELAAHEEELVRAGERVLEAGDRERRRLARDLHDGLQARLVLLAMRARNEVPATTAVGPGARQPFHAALDDAIDELRGFIQGVMPSGLIERDLTAAIEDLIDRVPVRTVLHAEPIDGPVSPVVESTLYFVVAEAVTNALKHAAPTQLEVRLQQAGGALRVEVVDDGAGPLHRSGHASLGLGLRSLEDRVRALGGDFVVDRPGGGGTRVWAEVPCAS